MHNSRRIRPWMLVSAAWIFPAAGAVVDRIAQARLNGGPPATARDLLWTAGDWFLYAFLTPGVFVVSRKLPLTRPHLARRVWLHLVLSLLFCVAWATAGQIYRFALGAAFNWPAAQAALAKPTFWSGQVHAWLAWVFTTFPFGIAVYLCVVGVEHAVRYFVEARERDVQLARVSEQLSSARLAALQAQLNPHFLFNSLNTVTVLVRDGNTPGATRVIEQLSDVLRRTLARGPANEMPLEEEVELAKQYLAVEQARFSDRLRPEFHVDPSTLSAAVPSFALQHLIENAVRHGIARRTDSGRITVAARRDGAALEITVTDDGAGFDAGSSWPEGRGLSNTAERLATLYGSNASLSLRRNEPHGIVATLRVPFRELLFEARAVSA